MMKEVVMISKKRENFVRLAEARVTKAQQSIRIVGNLANRANYEYTDEDVRQILGALQVELDDVKDRFKNQPAKSDAGFKLKA